MADHAELALCHRAIFRRRSPGTAARRPPRPRKRLAWAPGAPTLAGRHWAPRYWHFWSRFPTTDRPVL